MLFNSILDYFLLIIIDHFKIMDNHNNLDFIISISINFPNNNKL